jgi:dienelactone hydrolase
VQRVINNWHGNLFTQILTRAGYVVFTLDNRGSANRGTAFQNPIHDRMGDVEVVDQVQGARWLASQSFVDPKRIGVWGWSYGGYMTLMLMFKAPDVFQRRRLRRARHRLERCTTRTTPSATWIGLRITRRATQRAPCSLTPRTSRVRSGNARHGR